jgi:hypothetical protein
MTPPQSVTPTTFHLVTLSSPYRVQVAKPKANLDPIDASTVELEIDVHHRDTAYE